MEAIFFYLFAALTLVFALLVVANPFSRNPVTSAMFLVLAIGALAGLFVLLHSFFLAAVQVLVYAGAVMVLFLFVIMLLNLPEEERRRFGIAMSVLAIIAVGVISAVLLRAVSASSVSRPAAKVEGSTHDLGRLLFTQYLLPFEVVSVLLLVAMVGVVLLSRRQKQ